LLATFQFLQRAVHSDQDHVFGGEERDAVEQLPRLAQNVVHDDVVAARSHTGDGTAEAHQCTPERGGLFLRSYGPLRPHVVEEVHRHVEVHVIQDREKRLGDARLPRT
jgi:hypothetical protein